MYQLLIVKDTDSTAEIRNAVLISWVKSGSGLHIGRIEIGFGIGQQVPIKRAQQTFLNHFGDHIVGRAEHVIRGIVGSDLGIHDFVGFELIIDDLDAGFLFKLRNGGRINIFSPAVHINLVVFVPEYAAKKHGKQDDDKAGTGNQSRLSFS